MGFFVCFLFYTAIYDSVCKRCIHLLWWAQLIFLYLYINASLISLLCTLMVCACAPTFRGWIQILTGCEKNCIKPFVCQEGAVWDLINCLKWCHLSQHQLGLKKIWRCGVRKKWAYQTSVSRLAPAYFSCITPAPLHFRISIFFICNEHRNCHPCFCYIPVRLLQLAHKIQQKNADNPILNIPTLVSLYV